MNNNILPYDGLVHYFGKIMTDNEADEYFKCLLGKIAWEHDEIRLFGKKITTKRKVAWYGDKPFSYTYSKATKQALPWTRELTDLKARVETVTKTSYNSCLLNLYGSGAEGMGWHRDNEKELAPNGAIASVSLGAERRFIFKHRDTQEKIGIFLEHGSLLLMKCQTQAYWLHQLPQSKRIRTARINLTFRTIVQDRRAFR